MAHYSIEKWHEFDKDSCELIYKEAKEYFEETKSESEELTKRGLHFSYALAGVVSFSFGFIFKDSIKIDNKDVLFIVFSFIPYLICAYNCYKLLSVKNGRYRGISPEQWQYEIITSDDNKGYVYQTTFLSAMDIMYANIVAVKSSNTKRQGKYKTALISLLASVIASVLLIIFIYQF